MKKADWIRKIISFLLIYTLFVAGNICACAAPGKSAGEMQVHYIDIGQGDATLITSDGHAMLIDAGDNTKGTAVQLYLQKQGIEKLDYVIGTHADADHIGGLDVILYKFDCGTILMNKMTKDNQTCREVEQAMKEKRYVPVTPKPGTQYSLGKASFTIIAPDRDYGDDTNNASIGIRLINKNNCFLFTGDAEKEAEYDIVKSGTNIRADVYKVGHHGSSSSSSGAFLDQVKPSYAVISCGVDNDYGHPHAKTLNSLRARGIKVFRTDEQGTIVAVSDGTSITWNTAPSESWLSGENVKNAEGKVSADSTVAALAGASLTGSLTGQSSDSGVLVHITKTGKKYHNAGCRWLKSDITVTLEEAKAKGLMPCNTCHPPG